MSGGSFQIEDSPLYYAIVDDWIRFGRYIRIDDAGGMYREFERLPVYPAFLLALEFVFGRSDLMVAVVQAILDSFTCLFVLSAAIRYRPIVGVIAGVLAALSPNLIITSSLVVNDTLFLFLLGLSVFAMFRVRSGGMVFWVVLSGLALGTATITRPILVYFLPFVGTGFLIFAFPRSSGWVKRVARAAIFIVAASVPVAGVLEATADAYGKPFLTRQGGVHLLGWVLPMTHPDTHELAQGDASAVWFGRFNEAMVEQGLDPDLMPPVEIHDRREAFALGQLVQVPPLALLKSWVRGSVLNLALPAILYDGRVRSLSPGGFSQIPGDSIFAKLSVYFSEADIHWLAACLLAIVGAGVFGVLQVAGAIICTFRYPGTGISLLLAIGYILGILGPVFAAKYRLPIEPILIFFSAVAITFVWARLRPGDTIAGSEH